MKKVTSKPKKEKSVVKKQRAAEKKATAPKKAKRTADDKFILDTAAKIKVLLNAIHKRAGKIKEPNIGVFADLLVFKSDTKEALDGCSLGAGASVDDEMRYIDSVKGARMLRLTDNLIDNVSISIKRRRGIVK